MSSKRILIYCQHVLGLGHVARTFAVIQALRQQGQEIFLLLGGPPVSLPIPEDITVIRLPGLRMDAHFSGLQAVQAGADLHHIKQERQRQILDHFTTIEPDVLLIELYPFGRNAFHFELEPLLLAAQQQTSCFVVSSVRDILVERDNQEKFTQRALSRLNTFFDLVLVHSDPHLIRLEETFPGTKKISIPICYTGYIHRTALSNPEKEKDKKHTPLWRQRDAKHILISAGGGSVGLPLFRASIKALEILLKKEKQAFEVQIFTGPYLDQAAYQDLVGSIQRLDRSEELIRISRFSQNFPLWMQGADLSLSMGGYNTMMDILGAGCPALIIPFEENQEQHLRCQRLQSYHPLRLLDAAQIQPQVLAAHILTMLAQPRQESAVHLNGAEESARIILENAQEAQRRRP